MANAVYPKAKEHFAAGDVDWDANTITVYLVDLADYTYSASHDGLADLPAGARVASVALASKTNTNGLLDAADSTFTAVTGDVSEALIIANASYLLFYFDTGVTGLPVTPNGGDIVVTWNASGIVQL